MNSWTAFFYFVRIINAIVDSDLAGTVFVKHKHDNKLSAFNVYDF